MKSLMSFVLLMPMILAAAPSRALSLPAVVDDRCRDGYCPQPFPRPGSCPEGTRRVFDEYQGRFVCVADERPEPRPLPWRAGRAADGIAAELGKGDILNAAAGLDALFSGSAFKGSSAGAVYGGEGSASPRLSPAVPAGKPGRAALGRGVPAPVFRNVECGDKDGCRSETGKVVEDATKPIRDAIDKIGDRLRDRNDEKLREGTQRQRDAEREHKEKQERKERERPTV